MPGHGSSMAVQHGSLSLDLSDDAHDKDLRLATEVIRNGTPLLSSQTPSAERNNLVVPSQVDNASGSRSAEEEFDKLRVMDTLIETWRNDHPGAPLPRSYQKHVDKSVMTEKLAKHSKEQVALTVPANSHLSGQPVLGMSFFVNKRKEIARLAGNSVLRDKYDLGSEPIFEKFRVKKSWDGAWCIGDRPYYCVSEDILGRAIHTFQEEYVSKSKAQRISEEFDIHVNEIVAESKDIMSKEAAAIRMRNRNLIEEQHRLREAARIQCEKVFADANQRMKDTSDACEAALERQLKLLEESAIMEDTLLDEMMHASQAHRVRIQTATAIPPLVMDAERLSLQVRCAAAEEKAEDLQNQLQSFKNSEEWQLEKQVAKLQNELDGLQQRDKQMQRRLDSRRIEVARLRQEKEALKSELDSATKEKNVTHLRNLTLAQHTRLDEAVILGMRTRMETAEGELERLKRKRADSISPERIVKSILKRPDSSSVSEPRVAATETDTLSSSVKPTPKKPRRRERWNTLDKEHVQDMHSSKAPPTSSNQDGSKDKNGRASLTKRKDPVLQNTPHSFRTKQDIIDEIKESANTLGLPRSDTSLVFHRSTVEEQITVSKKALAYVELIITSTCKHLLKSTKFAGNSVKAYLDSLSLSQLVGLKNDVDAALGHCEDSSRYMAVYSGGSDFAQRIREQCFDKHGVPLRPHKLDDMRKKLHAQLGCHSLHSIPIGFYYSKWSEKLQFALTSRRSHSRDFSSRSRTPSPKTTMKRDTSECHLKSPKIASSSAARGDMSIEGIEDSLNKIMEKRAAIFDETKDGALTKKDKAVFWHRQERRREWQAVASEVMMNESEWNEQFDQESLQKLRVAEEQLETLLAEHKNSIGHGPAGQGSN